MIRHPAKYSIEILDVFKNILKGHSRILDPFAGTGKLRKIVPNAILVEIEPEWAIETGAIIGDATNLPFINNCFDAVCTSPTYGNRMADNFVCHKGYKRNTYRHVLGRELAKNNSGQMQWGVKYKNFHRKAWEEVFRVLKLGGLFILNISDHIRKGVIQEVTKWHVNEIIGIGFKEVNRFQIETKRNRFGANHNLRVPFESIILFKK